MFDRFGRPACVVLACGVMVLALGAGTALAKPVKSPTLVVNGKAEAGPAAADSGQVFAPQGWTTTGECTAIRYGASGGFPGAAVAKKIKGGKAFFAGGNEEASTASQTRAVPASWLARVQGGGVQAVLSAYLGGYESQEDNAKVVVTFLGGDGAVLGTAQVGPVTAADRAGVTRLVLRTATVAVPAQTVNATIVVTSTRDEGQYNDGYADNVSLVLRK